MRRELIQRYGMASRAGPDGNTIELRGGTNDHGGPRDNIWRRLTLIGTDCHFDTRETRDEVLERLVGKKH